MSHVVAADLLKRGLSRSARERDLQIHHVSEVSKRWSSCSFIGGQHEIVLTAQDGDAVRQWLDGLDERSFRIGGYIVVTLVTSTIEVEHGMIVATLDAMTVKEA